MKRSMTIIAALLLAASGPARGASVDFAKDIQPILQHDCIKCHGPDKQKAKLRLDSKEAAFKGGKDGVVITPGDAAKSELYRRITLPKGNDDLMPNEGDPLTKAQTDLIRDWINQGAVWPETVLARRPAAAQSSESALPANFQPAPKEQKAITALAEEGVEVPPIAMNVVWREANFRLKGAVITDAAIAPLKDIPSLVDLNLGATKITDAGLATLRGLTNLTRLHLELTGIGDAGLASLQGLVRLNYLNLYGTPVTDAGLEHLKGLTALRHLYLWQSKVTDAGVKRLRQALPNLDISTGWDISPLAKKQDAPAKQEEAAAKKDNGSARKEDKANEKKAPKSKEKDERLRKDSED